MMTPRGMTSAKPCLPLVTVSSFDGGAGWQRFSDAQHRRGLRFRVISGDPNTYPRPKTYDRVHIGTDGRGVVCDDPAVAQPAPKKKD